MTTLKGSEKQVAWAEQIKNQNIKDIEEIINSLTWNRVGIEFETEEEMLNYIEGMGHKREAAEKQLPLMMKMMKEWIAYKKVKEMFETTESAKWIIENKSRVTIIAEELKK